MKMNQENKKLFNFLLTSEEREIIRQKATSFGFANMSEYLKFIALHTKEIKAEQ